MLSSFVINLWRNLGPKAKYYSTITLWYVHVYCRFNPQYLFILKTKLNPSCFLLHMRWFFLGYIFAHLWFVNLYDCCLENICFFERNLAIRMIFLVNLSIKHESIRLWLSTCTGNLLVQAVFLQREPTKQGHSQGI